MAVATTKARTSTKKAPEAEPQTQTLTKSERDRLYAPNTSTVWVSYIRQIANTNFGFSFPGRDSVKVLIDGEFKKFNQDAGWFDIWDSKDGSNPLGTDFNSVLEEHGSVMVKVYWEWTSREDQLIELNEHDERTGKGRKKIFFKNPPKRRVLAYDIIMHGNNKPSEDAEVPETRPYGADCDNQEEIPF